MANDFRTKLANMGRRLTLKFIQAYGDVVTYIPATTSGVGVSIYAYSPDRTRTTFGPDEESIEWFVPVQSGITTEPSSMALIQQGSTKWAIKSVESDDGNYPTAFTLKCIRYLHESPEIDGQ